MKNLIILIPLILLTACAAPRDSTNQLKLGMSPEAVQSIMGTPESSSASQGQECFNYSLWRDFWNRKPGDYSDRYYTCFENDRLVSYGNYEDL